MNGRFYLFIFLISISLINAILHMRNIIFKLKFGKILNEESFLKEFFDKEEKLLWSEIQITKKPKLKILLTAIGFVLLSFTVILLIVWEIELLLTSIILSELWLETILKFTIYIINSSLLFLIFGAFLFKRETLTEKVTYYLSNKRLFSTHMRLRDKHIMTFNVNKIQFFDFRKKSDSKLKIYDFFFKTVDLSEEDIKSSILIFSAKHDPRSPFKYRYNIIIDDGWRWNSETNECVIKIKHIGDKDGIINNLKSLKIYSKELPLDWKKKYGFFNLRSYY